MTKIASKLVSVWRNPGYFLPVSAQITASHYCLVALGYVRISVLRPSERIRDIFDIVYKMATLRIKGRSRSPLSVGSLLIPILLVVEVLSAFEILSSWGQKLYQNSCLLFQNAEVGSAGTLRCT